MDWKRGIVPIFLTLTTLLVTLVSSAVIPATDNEETTVLATIAESTTSPTDPEETSWFSREWSVDLGGLFTVDGWFSMWQSSSSSSGMNLTLTISGGFADASSSEESAEAPIQRRCEQLTAPLCRGVGYDSTWVPNFLNHTDQMVANAELKKYSPLVKAECSKDLPFFLCNVYVPECGRGATKPIPPCRSLCERVKSGCDKAMEKFGIVWPEYLSCDKFPASDDPDKVCTGQ